MGYVLHITDSTGGGAGRATVRLHDGLLKAGADSRLLCRLNAAQTPGAHMLRDTVKETPGGEAAADAWAKIARAVAADNRTSISNTMFSLGYPGYDLSALPLVRNASILHLHWTPRILSIRGIERLLQLGKPTFWTQHDRWPTTQGGHFEASDDNFAEADTASAQLFQDYRLPQLLLEDKRASFDHSNLHIICLAEHSAELYKTQSIFTKRAISVSGNSIETEIFKPFSDADRIRARSLLGIESNAIIFLLLSQHGQEKRKGYAYVAEALRATGDFPSLTQAREAERIVIATIGAGGSNDAFPGFRTLPINATTDNDTLVAIMNACDALIMPSEQETFSLATLEAMACGLPAISFQNGGMPDQEIRTGQNGILIDGPQSPQSLANALDLFCSDRFDRAGCRVGARRTAEKFETGAVAREMLAIYRTKAELNMGPPPSSALLAMPEVKHSAPFDYAPSDWLGRQHVENAVARLLPLNKTPQPQRPAPAKSAAPAAKATPAAQPAPARKAPRPKEPPAPIRRSEPKPSILISGERIDLLPLLKLSSHATRDARGSISIARGGEGHAVFGPYIAPLPGRYRMAATLSAQWAPWRSLLKSRTPIFAEMSLNASTVLARRRWTPRSFGDSKRRVVLDFSLDEAACEQFKIGLEFRLWTDGKSALTLRRAELTRWDWDAPDYPV